MYNEKTAILSYLKKLGTKKFCFIHIDCDVSLSAQEIFTLLAEGDLLADKAYILYDDYGIEARLRTVVEEFNKSKQSEWNVTVHSETLLTKNFLFTKKK